MTPSSARPPADPRLRPLPLSHVNASVLKVKLATAIIGISSIHLLRTFINAQAYDDKTLFYQTTIHTVFLLSAMALAAVDRILPAPSHLRDLDSGGRHQVLQGVLT
jgi:uncharacterized protein (TIGR00645 family)